ncbi:ribbon-helix-helix domain-containing protein [Brevibacillus borstelensis]|uniref:ribbon-helix-helix domain-containing protein n=1 Tax=Brevibacillus borstelensis TaxID=45462 RepID=UPI001D0AFBC8|nr:CopG family transcriptional regulator [Brevibacillus borstelensis]MCC0566948.1 ribbon-helix-helix domain-containing protein [Brevibacillus borstelensis]
MFERRTGNLPQTVAQTRNGRDSITYGISWSSVPGHADENGDDAGIEFDWEEDVEVETADEISSPDPATGQYGQGCSDRPFSKNGDFRLPDHPYPGLRKRPEFDEQHKKLTIYVDKELMKTMEKLKKGRYIPSYSWLVAEAIKSYLTDKS